MFDSFACNCMHLHPVAKVCALVAMQWLKPLIRENFHVINHIKKMASIVLTQEKEELLLRIVVCAYGFWVTKQKSDTIKRLRLNRTGVQRALLAYVLTYLFTYTHTYLLTCLLTHSLTYLLTYLLIYLLTYLLTYTHTYLLTYLLILILTCLLAYLLTHSLTYLFTYLLTYLLT